LEKAIRILSVLAAIWVVVAAGGMALVGSALSVSGTERFNGNHKVQMACIALMVYSLLMALRSAYRLRTYISAVLFVWFVIASALLAQPPTFVACINQFGLLVIVLAPVSVLIVLLIVNGLSQRTNSAP